MTSRNKPSLTSEVVAASIGGAISSSILYPLEVLKTKRQAQDSDDNDNEEQQKISMVAFAQDVYEKEGAVVFFKGMHWSALQSALEKALYFLSYTVLQGSMPDLVRGYLADWCHLPITLPVDAVTTKIQTSKETPMKILLALLAKKEQMYQGISAYLVLCLRPAIQYTVYEQVKRIWLRSSSHTSLSASAAFVLGMLSRTVATLLIFPCLRAKVLLQTGGNQPIVDLLKQQAQRGTLLQGLGPELTRGALSAALMMSVKERVAVLVQTLLDGREQ